MDAILFEKLRNHGTDVDGTLTRFMNNGEFYEKYVRRFPEDPNFIKMKESIDDYDLENAFTYAHTLKGLADNLGFVELVKYLRPLVEDLRRFEYFPEKGLLDKVEVQYDEIVQIINS